MQSVYLLVASPTIYWHNSSCLCKPMHELLWAEHFLANKHIMGNLEAAVHVVQQAFWAILVGGSQLASTRQVLRSQSVVVKALQRSVNSCKYILHVAILRKPACMARVDTGAQWEFSTPHVQARGRGLAPAPSPLESKY